jgi:hypothetical protein
MSEHSLNSDATTPAARENAPYPYPQQPVVVAALGSGEQVGRAVEALMEAGVPVSDLDVACGARAAERMRGTGRSGWTDVSMRFTERIGLPNDEITLRNMYEDALTQGQFVVSVLAPNDERKSLAARLLAANGATLLHFLDKYSFEVL